MVDSHDDTDSAPEPIEDGQLTIRIPNPKVYMARQSMWIGRRGKPRCDHCRMKNLKCDRVLPTCNHCSWANGRECKYTPLPTPAHRGIPRCDRCRSKNLKCDRNLPICNHCSAEKEVECNYTPKKRHKVPSDHVTIGESLVEPYGTKTASFLVSDVLGTDDRDVDNTNDNDDYADHRHSFYGQNVASPSSRISSALKPRPQEDSVLRYLSKYVHSGRFGSDHRSPVWPRRSSLPPLPKISPLISRPFFASQSFHPEQSMGVSMSELEPWSHPHFTPLPDVILRRLGTVNSTEMPSRSAFDESLSAFLSELEPELQETAAFTAETYKCIASGDTSILSDRLRMWASYHHVSSGSNKRFLLIIPRDEFFHIGTPAKERLRADYIARTDGKTGCLDLSTPYSRDKEIVEICTDGTRAFERIPVQPQIYDVLVYAHHTHESSSLMLAETRRVGVATITWPMAEMFVRLCPLCNLRDKQGGHQVCDSETSIPILVE